MAATQEAFIGEVAPGAVAAQRKYGVPASVTIAQAIEESGWGLSELAIKNHNLFGMKGTGPAGTDPRLTQEYDNGHWVNHISLFRVYHNVAECIDDHGRLLAFSESYKSAMAVRHTPNAFAAALTGSYATDPQYGAKLVRLMRQHNLYRYDAGAPATPSPAPAPGDAAIPGLLGTPALQVAGAAANGPHRERPASAGPSTASLGAGSPSGLYAHLRRAEPPAQTNREKRAPMPVTCQTRKIASRRACTSTRQYQPHIPSPVRSAFIAMAKAPLTREEPLYRDVASHTGIRWELLAACDWMQCEARPRHSPVHGERLGTANPDGTVYRTKSEALERCAEDLVELALAVYHIDLTAGHDLSVRELASAFAAFRWGGLLKLHHTSAMEFPYAVAGLTAKHMNMRWPHINDPNAPDKPGARFHMPFGAVPIVLELQYPATI